MIDNVSGGLQHEDREMPSVEIECAVSKGRSLSMQRVRGKETEARFRLLARSVRVRANGACRRVSLLDVMVGVPGSSDADSVWIGRAVICGRDVPVQMMARGRSGSARVTWDQRWLEAEGSVGIWCECLHHAAKEDS